MSDKAPASTTRQLQLLRLQGLTGNRALQRLLETPTPQAKIHNLAMNSFEVQGRNSSQAVGQARVHSLERSAYLSGESHGQPSYIGIPSIARKSNDRELGVVQHQDVSEVAPTVMDNEMYGHENVMTRNFVPLHSAVSQKSLIASKSNSNNFVHIQRQEIEERCIPYTFVPTEAQASNFSRRQEIEDIVSNGIEIAIYTNHGTGWREFRQSAREFALTHNAFGVNNGEIIVGEESAAMAARSPTDVVEHIQNTIQAIKQTLGRENVGASTIALFAHGVNSQSHRGERYFNLGDGNEIANAQRVTRVRQIDQSGHPNILSIEEFVEQIDSALDERARVVLYACELGDSVFSGSRRRPFRGMRSGQQRHARADALHDEQTQGEGSFADELRDALNEREGAEREVWGHQTTAHTIGNPTWRRYSGVQGNGEHAADQLFAIEPLSPTTTSARGYHIHSRNLLHSERVRERIASQLEDLIPSNIIANLQNTTRRGFSGWVARELPFVPTPFVTSESTIENFQIRPEVLSSLAARAVAQGG